MAIQEIEKNFYQFIAECCEKVEESTGYSKADVKLKAFIDSIAAKLPDDDRAKLLGFDGLSDHIATLEATIQDDYFKAGFIAGVKLGQ